MMSSATTDTAARLMYYCATNDFDDFYHYPLTMSAIPGHERIDESVCFAIISGVMVPQRTAIALARQWADMVEFGQLPGAADHLALLDDGPTSSFRSTT